MSKKIAVIGIGNTLRRDDGIGIIILESLLGFYKRQDLDYFNFGNAGFDLLHRIKTYDAVLIIDGINAGFGIGEFKIGELKDIQYKIDDSLTSTHEFNLRSIFEFSKNLGIKTKIYLAGIQVGDTSFGEGLSEVLKHRREDIIKEIATFIDKTF
ncbi:MAG: hydrogenase maturation protease [Candidatus Omnitrophota bacterium]